MKAYYCSGTHWDREWYEPFQEFRMWLVELIDQLLDLLNQDPDYKCFHLDGQTVVLEDYLDIRPERKEELVQRLKERRILAGPWYNLPDEWLVSGESFVRNIMRGMRICRELGFEPMRFSYTPDQFGHIAALPMIMAGFELSAGLVWRGTQDDEHPAQFVWVGPDGSRMVTHKLADFGGYTPFRVAMRDPVKAAHFSEESYREHFDAYRTAELERAKVPLMLMLDAVDHDTPDPESPRMLADLRKLYPDVEFLWAPIEEYGEEMRRYAAELPEKHGELRLPARDARRNWQYLIVHTISSRYPLKKANDLCQAAMEKWAEPYALYQMMAGGWPVLSYLDTAWQWLLRNHPHDSICGCSIDQVHRDMQYRFDQCRLIADGLVRRAMTGIAGASASSDALRQLVVHNPLPQARRGLFELEVLFPSDWPEKYIDGLSTAERINKFVVKTGDGVDVPFQLSKIEHDVPTRVAMRENGRRVHLQGDLYHIVAQLDLPPAGCTSLQLEPSCDAVRNFGTLTTAPMTAANEHFSFTLHADGTGSLSHAASGKTYDGLFLYEDCGDTGDGWTFGRLVNDIVFRSPGTRVTTAIDEDGPLRTVFRVERQFDLPRRADQKTGWRDEDRRLLTLTDLIYVEKGAPHLRVRTSLTNTCMDHRFRVLFPTNIQADRSFADTPFAVVGRDIPIPPETAGWHERVNPEKAFTSFCGIEDAGGGLAVLAPAGLHEYEVMDAPQRILALTLFRATRQTVQTKGEPDGELLGPMDFTYSLLPFSGALDPRQALRLIAEEQAPIRLHHAATLPGTRSFLSIEQGQAVATAVKPAADGTGGIVRLWNPTDSDVSDSIRTEAPLTGAWICNLNEEKRTVIPLDDSHRIPVSVRAGGLLTVRFEWRR
jgi:alpha-mannosidase